MLITSLRLDAFILHLSISEFQYVIYSYQKQQSILSPREVYCCTEQATCCIETEVYIYIYVYILVAQRLVRPKLAWTLVNPENGMEGAS